jgi:hypothetical protein
MSQSPAFQFYPADWLGDENVSSMSDAQEGAYIRALCFCWREGSIPEDTAALMRMIFKFGSTLTMDDLRVVQRCFNHPSNIPGRLLHPRLEKERLKQAEWATKSKNGGVKSAEIRRENAKLKGGSTKGQPKANSSSSSSSLFSSSKGEREEARAHVLDQTERAKKIMDAYPSKASRDNRPIKKTSQDIEDLAALIALHPEYPWEAHAKLMQKNPTPFDFANWLKRMPDLVAYEALHGPKKDDPAETIAKAEKIRLADLERANAEWDALPPEEKEKQNKIIEGMFRR